MTGIIGYRSFDSWPFKSSENSYLAPTLPNNSYSVASDEVDNVDYCFESARLHSFKSWPLQYMEPEKLAAAGFYYTGKDDKVKCFECHVEICQWLEGDNPMVDHQRWSGRCRFIRKIPCGNVPLGVDPSTIPPPKPRSRDSCGTHGVEYRPLSGPDSHSFSSDLEISNSSKLGSLGVSRQKVPEYPQYASYEERLGTFETWHKSLPLRKERLADAGFYYTGKGDQTLCYHCGGGLKDWEPEDDPWEQHAKWFFKCQYLLLVKGQDYINKITGQTATSCSREEETPMKSPSCAKEMEQPAQAEMGEGNVNNSGSCSAQSRSQDIKEKRIEPSKEGSEDASAGENRSAAVTACRAIDDARMCKICYNGELGVLFLPCGHIIACVKCAKGMRNCAVCRKPVSNSVQAFLS